jgi:hypothetical protein
MLVMIKVLFAVTVLSLAALVWVAGAVALRVRKHMKERRLHPEGAPAEAHPKTETTPQ